MSKKLARIHRMVAAHEPGRGKRYPAAVRREVVRYALHRRGQNASWATIADELGLWFETLRRWCAGPDERAQCIVPVEVVEAEPTSPVVIVSPSGFRLEGLGPAEAVAALKALR